ncbi:MAG: aminoglycoside phosphotransferase family protein [Caulobacteraceae bacterium]
MHAKLRPYVAKWGLVADGEPFSTRTSALAPVRWNGLAAMLKIALIEEERRGAGADGVL